MIATGASAFLLAVLLAQGHHAASSSRKAATTTASTSTPAPKREASAHRKDDAATSTAVTSTAAEPTTTEAKPAKTRTYTFGAMDVEGKMKTPQLLYFLNRVKLELEMSAPDKKSFMKDLEQSANDSSL